ncbi:MAG: ABC transporter permease [Ignavibacteriae bacterium]|nr:ABC transporter permease [Ignavibacteriota bacterium]NOG97955.1 ABC transporter permease [Ignavibacteriota bacterium]
MLLKLSWRNIWRNKRRSLVVLGSVIVGIIAVLFMNGFMNGMLNQMLSNQISTSVSHIQIHKKGFNDNKTVQNYLPNPANVDNILRDNKDIKAFSKRVITFGLISSASNSSGVYINGIVPEEEKQVSIINRQIVEGEYFSGGKGEIVIGSKLAEKLDVTLGDKVVAMSNTPSGTIGSEVFRVVGIFKTFSSEFDKSFIYIPMQTVQEMLNIDDKIYEFAIVTKDYHKVEEVKNSINEELNQNYEVLSYKDLLPFLVYQIDLSKESMWIFNVIIELALIFGIINAMLMAVFERINEIGVLMSIGMKNIKIFTMILLEGLIIGIIGTAVGLGLGYLIMLPLQKVGLNLAIYTESLESFGVGAVIYPTVSIDDVIGILIAIPFISIVGAIYPAYKAIKLDPVYAIRYV